MLISMYILTFFLEYLVVHPLRKNLKKKGSLPSLGVLMML